MSKWPGERSPGTASSTGQEADMVAVRELRRLLDGRLWSWLNQWRVPTFGDDGGRDSLLKLAVGEVVDLYLVSSRSKMIV